VEIERARAAARIMAERLQIKPAEEINEKELFGDDETDEKQTSNVEKDPQDELLGRDLDNEVVRTETRSLRDLKFNSHLLQITVFSRPFERMVVLTSCTFRRR